MVWHRHLGLITVAAVIIVVIVVGLMPRPVLVDTDTVSRDPLRVSVEEEGRTRVTDRYVVSAPVAGYIRRVELDVGDTVDKDQGIVHLEPLPSTVLDPRSRAEAEARVSAAKAALRVAEEQVHSAEADYNYTESELHRMQRLYESGNVSQEALQSAEVQYRKARSALQSAQFSVDVARYDLKAAEAALQFSASSNGSMPATVTLRSPVKGSVLKIQHKSEGVVSAGEAILELGDPLSLEVEVDVLSRDAVRIEPGTRVLLKRWGSDAVLDGVVRTVEPVGFTKISALGVEEQRVLVIVDINSPVTEWRRLGDGYRVEAEFVLWEGDDILQVPSSALFREGEDWAVFALADGRAQLRSVEIGRRSGLRAQIVSGLEEDERVIVHPGNSVEDGVRIRAR